MDGNVLSPDQVAMIAKFIAMYEFDVGEFLDWHLRDREVGGEKSLLVYPHKII